MNRIIRVISCCILLALTLSGCKEKSTNVTNENIQVAYTEEKKDTEDKDTKEINNNTQQEETVPSDNESTDYNQVDGKADSESNRSISYLTIYQTSFDKETSEFLPRGNENVKIEIQGKNKILVAKNRTETWQGPRLDLTNFDLSGKKIRIKAEISYYGEGILSTKLYCKLEKDQSEYIDVGTLTINSGEWISFEGEIRIPEYENQISLYFETEYSSTPTKEQLVDICLDNVSIEEVMVQKEEVSVSSLKEYYKDYFHMGIGVEARTLKDKESQELINYHFDSITMGNEMKPDYILDYNQCVANLEVTNTQPAIHYSNLKIGLEYAKEHGLKLRGHTLVWHSQTPTWFFKENYSKDAKASLASKEVMLQRMESYIRQIFEYINTNFPGIVYAYDVVNEGILPGDGDSNGYRVKDSLWYQTIGAEYIEKAFEYARKYAEPEVKLFYNDFNTYETTKRYAIYELCNKLKEKGLIDGIGMQSHITTEYPSLIDYQKTIEKFAELDLELQITELDMDMKENTQESMLKQGTRYKRLFLLYKNLVEDKKANITSVTFWGLSDDTSWLNSTTKSYPLLFDSNLQPKPAFYGAIQDDRIPLY